jgi:hypothetical protein
LIWMRSVPEYRFETLIGVTESETACAVRLKHARNALVSAKSRPAVTIFGFIDK